MLRYMDGGSKMQQALILGWSSGWLRTLECTPLNVLGTISHNTNFDGRNSYKTTLSINGAHVNGGVEPLN